MAKIYIDNAKYMEFIDDIATQITIFRFPNKAHVEIKDGLSDRLVTTFKEDAQDFYNEQYDWVEEMVNNTLNIHSNNELIKDN